MFGSFYIWFFFIFFYVAVYFLSTVRFLFVVGSRVVVVLLLAVVALLSVDFSENGFRFLFFVSCGSDGGIDMITYSVLAQSFLTSILRVGVWIILALFCSWHCSSI